MVDAILPSDLQSLRCIAMLGRLERVRVVKGALGCSLGAAVAVADAISIAWNEPKAVAPANLEIDVDLGQHEPPYADDAAAEAAGRHARVCGAPLAPWKAGPRRNAWERGWTREDRALRTGE